MSLRFVLWMAQRIFDLVCAMLLFSYAGDGQSCLDSFSSAQYPVRVCRSYVAGGKFDATVVIIDKAGSLCVSICLWV
jgi:hypothetical protein